MSDREAGQLYSVAMLVVEPVFRFLWRIQVTGLEHVPPEGAAIFCPNHISVLDSFFVPAILPRRITYVGKAEYMDSWKTKYLFPALGMIPIDRTGGSASERALSAAARVLERGEFFGIYPEGTRSRSGKLYRGRTGAARLALRTGAPLIPVGIRGTADIMPPDSRWPKFFRAAQVNIGRPIRTDRYRDRADDHMVLRQLTDELMFEIRELSGQEYVDSYSGKAAQSAPSPTANGSAVPAAATGGADGSEAPPSAPVRRLDLEDDETLAAAAGAARSSAEVLAAS